VNRLPMVGDIVRTSCGVDQLVVSVDNKVPQSNDFVFNTVPFMDDMPMSKLNHNAYHISFDRKTVVGGRSVILKDLEFINSAKIKETKTDYVFVKYNK